MWTAINLHEPHVFKKKKKKKNFYFKFCNEKSCEVCAFQKCIPSISNSWGPSSAQQAEVLKKFLLSSFPFLKRGPSEFYIIWELHVLVRRNEKQTVALLLNIVNMLLNRSMFSICALQNEAQQSPCRWKSQGSKMLTACEKLSSETMAQLWLLTPCLVQVQNNKVSVYCNLN